jgi:hypothetical protein
MPDTTTKTQTPAEELRAAAKTLRCKHSFPCQPPLGSVARPGDCSKCGTSYDYSEPVTDDARDLRKRLAELFDHMANELEDASAIEYEVRLDDGRRRKFVRPTVEVQSVGPDFVWTAGLKIARTISGEAF